LIVITRSARVATREMKGFPAAFTRLSHRVARPVVLRLGLDDAQFKLS